MTKIDMFKAEFAMMRQSDKAIVANYIDMRTKHPGFEAAFDAWERKNDGYTISEFFDFLDSYEASGTHCGFGGQSVLN